MSEGGGEMVIYLDVLIALNIFINYLILLCASKLSGVKTGRIRLVFSALLGGVGSLVILLPEMNAVFSFLLKASVTVLLTLTAFSFNSFKTFLKALLSFSAVNIAFAGVSLALYFLFPPKNMLYSNGVVYFDIDIGFFIAAAPIYERRMISQSLYLIFALFYRIFQPFYL